MQPEVSSPVEVKKKSVKLSRVVTPLLEQVGSLTDVLTVSIVNVMNYCIAT